MMPESRPQRILVAGAGAIGLVFGGFLAQAGHQVTLLGRPEGMAAITRAGLTITGLWGTHLVTQLRCATHAGELAGPFDQILVTVKSWGTAEIARATLAVYLIC